MSRRGEADDRSGRRSGRRDRDDDEVTGDRGSRRSGRGGRRDDRTMLYLYGGIGAAVLLILIIVMVVVINGGERTGGGAPQSLDVEAATLLGRMQQAVESRDLSRLERVIAEYQRFIQAVQAGTLSKPSDYEQIQSWSRRVRDTHSELTAP
jgi:hypothetical protein